MGYRHEILRRRHSVVLLEPLQLTLHHGTHIDAQGDIVILDTLLQRRGVDDVLLEVIRRDVLATGFLQLLQNLLTLLNLADSERRQPVEVNDGLAAGGGTLVALRPLLDVTIQADGRDITTRYDVHRLAIRQQIGEGQTAHVGMVHQLAETHREGAYLGRHQHVGTAGGLRAALQRSVVQGTHLVSVVREVGVRTGIVERELAADEQARLMVRCREGSAEGGTRLAISHVAVGEEHAGLGSKAVGNLTCLANEAVLHLHAVGDAAAVADDGVLADDSRANIHRGVSRRHDGTVGKTGGAIDFAVVLHHGIGNLLRVDNLHAIADGSPLGLGEAYLFIDESCDVVLQLLVLEVFHHEGCQL